MKKSLKTKVYKNKQLANVILPVYHKIKKTKNFTSGDYWENRYSKGGDSGAGSYGRLATFKAEVLNEFIRKNSIKSVIELGSGDGSQLKHFNFKDYIGLDISKTSIALCLNEYEGDDSKSFFLYDSSYSSRNRNIFKADLTMSLDVIYHLVEDDVFDAYMKDLFQMSKKFVAIYSSNTDDNEKTYAQHVKNRKFTDWIKNNTKDWVLKEAVENKFKLQTDEIDESFADFYFYEQID